MLEPGERQLLADALRPPDGYQFDSAVSTTYTLDLLTLLTMPVAFTLYHWATSEGRTKLDPLALLDAVRRHARHICVFCQAGRIAVPKRSQLLFGYLEGSVVEATAPNGGAFHPKVTVLRYTGNLNAADGDDNAPESESVCYRVLCASRNLTFDRSWDTLLTLEGKLDLNRVNAFARNRGLSRFVGALPAMATRPIGDEAKANIERFSDELLRVRFEEPEGFNDFTFWPIGLDEREVWPFDTRTDRVLVVSPFVDRTFLNWMADETDELHLVSRVEALDTLPETSLGNCDGCYVLNDSAQSLEPRITPEDEDGAEVGADRAQSGEESVEIEPSEVPLRGLHAKLFVADAGWDAKVWAGSANATSAAFNRNVEFLVELMGRASRHGVRTLLRKCEQDDNHDRHVGFSDLLVPYRRCEDVTAEDPIARQLENLIDEARTTLISAKLVAKVEVRRADGDPSYDLKIEATGSSPALASDVNLLVRPISLHREDAVVLKSLSICPVVTFSAVSFEALTGFLAVEATARRSGQSQTTGFVLNLPLFGAPEDRDNRLLLSLLGNRQRLLRYLLMLLADTDLDPRQLASELDVAQDDGNGDPCDTSFSLSLLEPLMRALDRDPRRLVQVARLLNDLRSTENGREMVPSEFMAIWEPIWSAREEEADAQA
ncbi:MAG: phospholipase D family protein [Desulfobulbaceae bacterium]